MDPLDRLAKLIRQIWVEERRLYELRTSGTESGWGSRHLQQWDGGETSMGKVCNAVWPDIAKFCVRHRLNPRILVRSIFYAHTGPRPPNPTCAKTPRALQIYGAQAAELSESSVRTAFESQKLYGSAEVNRIRNSFQVSEAKAWQITLASQHSQLSPLFRYVVAANQGWTELAQKYHYAATVQYCRAPEVYDKVWDKYLPDAFRGQARRELEVLEDALRAASTAAD